MHCIAILGLKTENLILEMNDKNDDKNRLVQLDLMGLDWMI